MAPLPDNLTERYYWDYNGASGAHTTMWRFQAGSPQSGVLTWLELLAPTLEPLLTNEVVTEGWRYSAAGTNFSLPLSGFPVISGSGLGVTAPSDYPRFLSFVGRGFNGRRTRFTLFNVDFEPDNDYRLPQETTVVVNDVLQVLNNPGAPFSSIDGAKATFKPYANMGFNAYYQRKRRVSG